jgi:hypothetical protein
VQPEPKPARPASNPPSRCQPVGRHTDGERTIMHPEKSPS